ncbi:MAG TPA: hypothetical protein VLA88_04550 [Candidatus Saccharimonadales bacterium]|nr:hypothetical protein [Candidatus Saccharimonadales bacterium]
MQVPPATRGSNSFIFCFLCYDIFHQQPCWWIARRYVMDKPTLGLGPAFWAYKTAYDELHRWQEQREQLRRPMLAGPNDPGDGDADYTALLTARAEAASNLSKVLVGLGLNEAVKALNALQDTRGEEAKKHWLALEGHVQRLVA